MRPNNEKVRRMNVDNLDGGFMNSAFEGCNRLVSGSNLDRNVRLNVGANKLPSQQTSERDALGTEPTQIAVGMTGRN